MTTHAVPTRVYYTVFAALMVLTAVTVSVALVDLGRMNTIVALAIAVTKAVLVILYFMHVRYSSRLTWIVVSGGFLWLVVMIALIMSDVLTRGWLGFPGS